ncbi:unnamed protein product [Phyllotreta striolata]|uniref:RRM domain-containing protein n=1 Tax=Phyllotreta striolata TaxID=444603 RepID=A0A9N9XNN3_PHYSR|nr:unnamed protein product [Phyllotreta striolata]
MDQYTVKYVKFQKVITHRLCNSMFVPESSSEVFVKNLPTVVREEDLLKFFQTVGDVYKIRIMMDNNLLYTRGFCYVTYVDPSMAKRAVRELNNVQYELNHYLLIESSLNNCRIFMGGIPTNKTKDAVWQELINHGVPNIIDVIMYRSYTERAQNRGFVFVEFQTHEQAAYFRAKYSNVLKLWNRSVIIDWSVPMSEVDETVLNEVKIVYMKNLDVSITPEQFRNMIHTFVHEDHVEKIYKFKNYAFVHLRSRHLAENLMKRLQDYYKGTSIEIEWAKPRSQYTTPEYRQLKVKSLSQSRSRNSSSSSTISLPDELWRTPSPRVYTPSPSPESSCFTFTRPQEAPERPNFNIPKATPREFYNPQPSERVAGPCTSPQNVQSAGPWKNPPAPHQYFLEHSYSYSATFAVGKERQTILIPTLKPPLSIPLSRTLQKYFITYFATDHRGAVRKYHIRNENSIGDIGNMADPSTLFDLTLHKMVCNKGDFSALYDITHVNGQLIATFKRASHGRRGTEVFVKNLEPDVLLQEIFEFVLPLGEVYQIRLLLEFSGYCRGYCYVNFFEVESARKAMMVLCGRKIRGSSVVVKMSFDNNRLEIADVPKDRSVQEIFQELSKVIGSGLQEVFFVNSRTDKHCRNCILVYNTHKNALEARKKMFNGFSLFEELYEEIIKIIKPKHILNIFLQSGIGHITFENETVAYNSFKLLEKYEISGVRMKLSFTKFYEKLPNFDNSTSISESSDYSGNQFTEESTNDLPNPRRCESVNIPQNTHINFTKQFFFQNFDDYPDSTSANSYNPNTVPVAPLVSWQQPVMRNLSSTPAITVHQDAPRQIIGRNSAPTINAPEMYQICGVPYSASNEPWMNQYYRQNQFVEQPIRMIHMNSNLYPVPVSFIQMTQDFCQHFYYQP